MLSIAKRVVAGRSEILLHGLRDRDTPHFPNLGLERKFAALYVFPDPGAASGLLAVNFVTEIAVYPNFRQLDSSELHFTHDDC